MGLPVTTPAADPPPGGQARVRSPWAVARAALAAPFTRRQGRELLFCLAGLPFAVINPLALFVLAVDLTWLVAGSGRGNPSPAAIAIAIACVGLLPVLLVSTRAARGVGSLQRMIAARLLGTRVAPPPPGRRSPGARAWPGPGPRDGAGWRVMVYLLAKLPVALIELYAVFLWVGGLVNLGYPLWWGAFRNHPPGTRLSPVPVFTPLGLSGDGTFRVATLPGTFAAAAAGAAMLLAAPWVTRAVTSADAWLIRGLLGPGRLAQRVHDLELSRALAVDDSAALLRRLERNLHDGAQIRLATLAMNLGMAREKLGDGGEVPDAAAARELVDAALRGAKDALGELRNLARGIHPPVLDNGLADALASLAADSATPVELEVSIPVRPTPAIETIAYFCAAELLANAAKHSFANKIAIRAAGQRDVLLLSVADEGTGGADPARGSGLSGLAQRAAVVDGRLDDCEPARRPDEDHRRAPAARMNARVVIAEDAALFRAGLTRLIEDHGHRVCAAVADGGALLAAVAEHQPDVVVADIRMPPTHTDEGLRAALEIRRQYPRTGVLVLSQYIETTYTARLLEGNAAGAGYLLKERVADVAEFTDALERVAAGGTALDPEVVGQLLRASRRADGLTALTARERHVLALMAEGRSNAGIADALVVTGGTVEKHVASIFDKLGLPQDEADNRRVLAVLRYLDS